MKWAWATHVPLLKGIMKIKQPVFVYESGIGEYSTPLFQKKGVYYVGVENDAEWIKKMSEKYPDSNFIHQRLSRKVNKDTRYWNCPDQSHIFVDFRNIYEAHSVKGYSLLFVDGFASTRKVALEALMDKFDCVVFHDSNQGYLYGYSEVDMSDFHRYELVSKINSTAVLVKDPSNMDLLAKEVNICINEFNRDWKTNSEMFFKRV